LHHLTSQRTELVKIRRINVRKDRYCTKAGHGSPCK
jgi:hypothetical protein